VLLAGGLGWHGLIIAVGRLLQVSQIVQDQGNQCPDTSGQGSFNWWVLVQMIQVIRLLEFGCSRPPVDSAQSPPCRTILPGVSYTQHEMPCHSAAAFGRRQGHVVPLGWVHTPHRAAQFCGYFRNSRVASVRGSYSKCVLFL
jgi:hypothetical protein